jgi:nucleoside-diphosphate-sugar epimerase
LKALVTGQGGFLGRYVSGQLLDAGYQVRGFARGAYADLQRLGVQCVQGDLRDAHQVAEACRDVDVVFHVAGVAGIWGPWKHYYEVNTLGTHNVVAGCQQHGVPRLVYTSSPSVTFDGRPQSGVDETVPYPAHWLCHYPHSKALAEQHVLAADGQQGLRTCSLRPHLIWGPGDEHLIPRLMDRARQGTLRRVGDGRNQIDMIYVENAAAAHLQAADALHDGSPVCGRAYFLSQGEPVNCWDWINELLGLGGLPPIRRGISYRAAWIVGGMLEAAHKLAGIQREPRMTRFLAAQLATDHYFDIRRAQQDFGYVAGVSTEEGMEKLRQVLGG